MSLITEISSTCDHLSIVNTTAVHLGHFTQDIASQILVLTVISFPSAWVIWSPHFNHAFSDGDPAIGVTILNIHGSCIST